MDLIKTAEITSDDLEALIWKAIIDKQVDITLREATELVNEIVAQVARRAV